MRRESPLGQTLRVNARRARVSFKFYRRNARRCNVNIHKRQDSIPRAPAIERKGVVFEGCRASGKVERLHDLAKELIAFKPDVILVGNPDSALAVHEASGTIPIVATTIAPEASATTLPP